MKDGPVLSGKTRRSVVSGIVGALIGGTLIGGAGYRMGQDAGEEQGREAGQESGYDEGYQEAWEAFGEPERHYSGEHDVEREATGTIEEGSHLSVELEPEREALVFLTAHAGDSIDILLLENDQYDVYNNGGEPEYLVVGTIFGSTEATYEIELDPGHYHFVFDNTDIEGTMPNGDVEFSGIAAMWEKSDEPPLS